MQKPHTKNRIETFDLMRGFFVLVIIIDHIQRWPGIFDWITGQGRLWVSAAEGFIFISGIMIGLIRGRGNITLPLWVVTKKLWWRAFTLYLWAVVTALATRALVAVWDANYSTYPPGLDSYSTTATLGIIAETLTLRGTFGWSVFLVQYTVYLFIAPIFVYALRKNLWWLGLSISAAIWLYGIGNDQYLLSWQFLFFLGATIGFYYKILQNKWQRFRYQSQVSTGIIIATLASLMLSVFSIFGWPIVKQNWSPISLSDMLKYRNIIDPFFIRSELRPIHLLLSLLWFFALYLLFQRYEQVIKQKLGWLLLRFGQNSLFVYILQGFVVVIISGLLPETSNMVLNACMIAGTIMLIWWLTGLKLLHKIIPR